MRTLLLLSLVACSGDIVIKETETDADSDGYLEQVDCDDGRADVNPTAPELCDGRDNDCDEEIDEDAAGASTGYPDVDGDGYGDPDAGLTACELPEGYGADATDCDDAQAAVHPGAAEVCDTTGTDEDCDGQVNEDDPDVTGLVTAWPDVDEDGYGDPSGPVEACTVDAGWVEDDTDCDDSDALVSPVGTETCNGIDDDCDALIDDNDSSVTGTSSWYADADRDGYGDPATVATACAAPPGYGTDNTDCDDADALVSPVGTETCNGIDDDCDALIDDNDSSVTGTSSWYADADRDGYGDADVVATACDAPTGYGADDTDCDDGDADVSPSETETCNGVDDDCDAKIDDDDASLSGASSWYADADDDGYGDRDASVTSCEAPTGYGTDTTDCDDTDARVSPAGTEICNGIDDDCDTRIDDADSSVTGTSSWYADADRDGYGDPDVVKAACTAPTGYGADDTDCDDADADVSPAGTETCNGIDDDCDLKIDDDDDAGVTGASSWYADADDDGYGDPDSAVVACDAPTGYGTDTSDCDDGDATISPDGRETCDNGVDEDCDGEDAACLVNGDYSASDAFATIASTTASSSFSDDLTSAGDVDGDGQDDIFLMENSATSTASNQGAGYLFLGPLSGAYKVTDADATVWGEDISDELNYTTFAGDLDGDGYDDLVAGGEHADPLGYYYEGGLWVVYGPVSGSMNVSAADAEIAGGIAYRNMRVTHGLGDIDGDGQGDLAVSTWGYGYSVADYATVFYGALSGDETLLDADIIVQGEDSGDGVGEMDGGEDIDGDGVADFVLGAPYNDAIASFSGALYVMYGPITDGKVTSQYDRRYTGDSASENFGSSVDLLPDLDGDGYADLIGSSGDEDYVAVVYGGTLPSSGKIASAYDAVFTASAAVYTQPNDLPRDAGDLDGNGDHELIVSDRTLTLTGTYRGISGIFDAPSGSLAPDDADLRLTGDTDSDLLGRGRAAGDMDGDGLQDVMTGVLWDDAGASNAGSVWLFAPR